MACCYFFFPDFFFPFPFPFPFPFELPPLPFAPKSSPSRNESATSWSTCVWEGLGEMWRSQGQRAGARPRGPLGTRAGLSRGFAQSANVRPKLGLWTARAIVTSTPNWYSSLRPCCMAGGVWLDGRCCYTSPHQTALPWPRSSARRNQQLYARRSRSATARVGRGGGRGKRRGGEGNGVGVSGANGGGASGGVVHNEALWEGQMRYEVLCEAPRCQTPNRRGVGSHTPSRFRVQNSLHSFTSERASGLVGWW